MAVRLVALDDNCSILLDKPIILIGRHPECDIQLDSRKVSRRHCCIAQVQNYLVVRDLGSTNGIRINGHPVLEGRLHTGDELIIGNLRYQVRYDPPGDPRPPRRDRQAHQKADPPNLANTAAVQEDDASLLLDPHDPLIQPPDNDPS